MAWGPLREEKQQQRKARNFLLQPYFSVRHLEVKGTTKSEEVADIARLKACMSVWKINLRAVERRIRKLPWVRKTVDRQEFPDLIVIELMADDRCPGTLSFVVPQSEGFPLRFSELL